MAHSSKSDLVQHEKECIENVATTCFDNPGFRSDIRVREERREIPLQVLRPPSKDRTSRHAQTPERRREPEEYERQRQRYADRLLKTMALETEQNVARSRGRKRKYGSFTCCINIGVFMLLSATIVASAYVLYQYKIQLTHSCNPPTISSPQNKDTQERAKLQQRYKKLKDEIDQLSTQVIQFIKSNKTKCKAPNSLREERRRFQMLSRKVDGIKNNLQIVKANLTNKINNVDHKVKNSLEQLKFKMSNISETVQRETNNEKCAFKTKASISLNHTISIVQNKNDKGNFMGVTCCTFTSQIHQNYSSFLTAREDREKIIYSCHCLSSKQCHLCYWDCS